MSTQALSIKALESTSGESPGLGSAEWQNADAADLETVPTPSASQPSAYVRQTLIGETRHQVGSVTVGAMTSSDAVHICLEWAAAEPVQEVNDYDAWADACALMIPVNGDADIETMGSADSPVAVVHWMAGREPTVALARGIGTTRRETDHGVIAEANWADGRWRLLLSCPFDEAALSIPKKGPVPIAVAIWSGTAAERAGVKSHTPVWHELTIS